MTASPDLTALDRGSYLSLTTFKRDGTPVATPVWFAVDGASVVLYTGAESGKVKRLRHTPAVTVAPCDPRGRVKGDVRTGTARVLPAEDHERVHQVLNRKYGVQKHAFEWANRIAGFVRRRPPEAATCVEITLE